MLKFLRKYNTLILVVGGSLLMVVFLMPEVLNQVGANMGRRTTAFRVGGEKVSVVERDRIARELAIINGLLPSSFPDITFMVARLDPNDDADRWVLMVKEAERAGLVGGPKDGASFLPQLAQLYERNAIQARLGSVNAQLLLDFMQNQGRPATLSRRVTEEELDMALAHLHGVIRLRGMFASAQRISRPRAIREARDVLTEAEVSMVFLPAERDAAVAGAPEPTEEALVEFFEARRELAPEESDDGIGYLLAPRVKLEYLTIRRAGLASVITPDPIEVYQRYERSGREDAFADVRPIFEKEIIDERINEILREADRAVEAAVRAASAKLADSGEFQVIPEGWDDTPVSMETLRDAITERVRKTLGVEITPPEVTILDESWQTADDLVRLGELGRSQVRLPVGGPVNFPQGALGVREIESTPNRLATQVGLPCTTPFETFPRDVCYFRILGARDQSPPDSIDEVRERVVDDYKTMQAYETMLDFADDNRVSAVERGLDFLADTGTTTDPDLRPVRLTGNINVRQDFATIGTSPRGAISARELDEDGRKAILEVASQLDPTIPAADQDLDMRTLALPNRKERGVAIVRIDAFIPATRREFLSVAGSVGGQIRVREYRAAIETSDPFSLESLIDRLDVTGLEQRDRDGEDEAQAQDEPEAADA